MPTDLSCPHLERDFLSLLLDRYWFAPPVALWRAVELRTLAAETFTHPILDLGCGDGLIAQALFNGAASIEVGFDPWWDQVRKAPDCGVYRYVQQARGDAMPYPGGERFSTVFSNSVLEHIPRLAPVLSEVCRVLKPGGRLLITVPSDAFHRLLAGYQAHVAVGDLAGAEAYARRVDQRLEHYRYLTPQQWEERLACAGLRLVHYRYYIPAEVARLWDRANVTYGIVGDTNAPGRSWGHLYRWLASPRLRGWGYQSLVRALVVRRLGTRWRDAYNAEVPEGGIGAGLLVVGEKV
jgi:SAM-dependent methyltransferase